MSTSIPFTFNSPQSQYIPNNQQPTSDEWEYTVIKFGSEISLRGRLGKYLTVIPGQQPSVTPALPVVPANLNNSRSSFSVADGGQVIDILLLYFGRKDVKKRRDYVVMKS